MFARERTKVTLKIKELRGRSAAGRPGVAGQHLSMVLNGQRHSEPLGAGSGEEKNGRDERETAIHRGAGGIHQYGPTQQMLPAKPNAAARGGAGGRIA
jgi:hypothetical protein